MCSKTCTRPDTVTAARMIASSADDGFDTLKVTGSSFSMKETKDCADSRKFGPVNLLRFRGEKMGV